MIVLSAISMAWDSITSNKMRSFLTMLGIIIGVGAVIILVSLVQGLSGSINDTFESIGTTNVMVSARGAFATRSFDYEDVVDLVEANEEDILGFYPSSTSTATIRVGGTNGSANVLGVNGYYAEANDLSPQLGRMINEIDLDNTSKVAVIGEYEAIEYFGSVRDALSKIIKINGEPFTVVGILERQTDDVEQYSSDDTVHIPYTTAHKVLKTGNLMSFTLVAKNSDSVEHVMSVAKKFMYTIYQDEDRYSVTNLQAVLDQLDEVMGTLSAVLGGIAGISLLVAGIGIMNIMLVSVTERTREIGIRKSIGAKRSSILLQFVVEAMTLSFIGGIIGIIFGAFVAAVLGRLIGITARPTAFVIFLALGFSSAVGLFFGFNPARKASKLNPIEALRSE